MVINLIWNHQVTFYWQADDKFLPNILHLLRKLTFFFNIQLKINHIYTILYDLLLRLKKYYNFWIPRKLPTVPCKLLAQSCNKIYLWFYIHFVCGKLITLIEVFAIKILLKLRFASVLHNEQCGSNWTQQATRGHS